MGQVVTLTISRRYNLPVQGPGDEPKYKVELLPAEGAVQVSDGTGSVLVSLTSAVMREPAGQCLRAPRPTAPPPHRLPRDIRLRQFHTPIHYYTLLSALSDLRGLAPPYRP